MDCCVTNALQVETHEFDYLAVATGHFSYPNNPTFENEKSYTGEILHSHDFTDSRKYHGKRVLIVGGSLSAEDIAMNCWKSGSGMDSYMFCT